MNLDEFVTIRGWAPPGPVIDTSLRLFRPGAPRADHQLLEMPTVMETTSHNNKFTARMFFEVSNCLLKWGAWNMLYIWLGSVKSRKKDWERDTIKRIDDYNAGWGVSNHVLKRCFFIIIIHGNMDFRIYGVNSGKESYERRRNRTSMSSMVHYYLWILKILISRLMGIVPFILCTLNVESSAIVGSAELISRHIVF
jgi:hypothetical protein